MTTTKPRTRVYPFFAPHGERHLAAEIAVPDAPVRAVVLFSSRAGASLGWIRTWHAVADALADSGLASVRFDYNGMGQSTELVREWSWELFNDIAAQARSVATSAMAMTGSDQVVAVGSCLGGRVSLDVAANLPQCVGAICIDEPLLDPASGRVFVHAGRTWIARVIRSSQSLRKLGAWVLGVIYRRMARRAGSGMREACEAASLNARLIFVSGVPQSVQRFAAMVSALPPEQRDRCLLVQLPWNGALGGLESLRVQRLLIDSLPRWVRRLSGSAPVAAGDASAMQSAY